MPTRHIPYLGILPRREIKEFLITMAVQGFSTSIITLFEPIYLYTLGYSISWIMLFYVMVYGVYFFLLPLGGKIARRLGYERAFFFGTLVLAAYFLSLVAIGFWPSFFFIAPVVFALQKMLYWPAYHGDLARFGRKGHRGRELSILSVIIQIVAVIGPVVGGLILEFSTFTILFLVAIGLLLVSVIPLFTTREKFTPGTFSYKGAFRYLFARKNFRHFAAYFGYGEELIVLTIWPIFIYIVISDFLSIGSIIAVATIFSIVVTLIAGRFSDRLKTRWTVLTVGTLAYIVSFLTRIFAKTPIGIFFFDSFSRISKTVLTIPFVSTIYDTAKKSKDDNLMHEVVFFEQVLSLGKLLAAGIVGIVFMYTQSFFTAFVIAAVFALLYLFLKPNLNHKHA
ncbi:MFS transporter [Patescibacteria group bacterium]